MTRRLIVVGDSHSHGGLLDDGCPHARIAGRPIVRLGDAASCALHGATYVATATSRIRYYGALGACDGDELACGSRLIAGQKRVGST